MATFTPVFMPSQTVKNEALLTNRLGLNMKFKPMEDVQVKTRLLMYKVWGHETGSPVTAAMHFLRTNRISLTEMLLIPV